MYNPCEKYYNIKVQKWVPEMKSCIILLVSVLVHFGCSSLDKDDTMWTYENLDDFVIYAFGPGNDFIAVIDAGTGEISQLLKN